MKARLRPSSKPGKVAYSRELFDLCARTDTKKLNRRVLEKLIMSGAFDRLGPHRAALMNSLGDALKAADYMRKRKLSVRPICSACWPKSRNKLNNPKRQLPTVAGAGGVRWGT
ncbi:hypothetical protein ACLK1Z_01205 [Escherichia coli]